MGRAYPGVPYATIPDSHARRCIEEIDKYLRDVTRGATAAAGSGSGGGAPLDSSYLTAASEATLTGERRLVTTSPLTGTDGGPNSTYTLGVSASGLGTFAGAIPTFIYGTTFTAGSANTFIRTDAQHKFPQALMSTANSATAMFTDNAVDTTLTSSLGNFILVAGGSGGLVFDVDPVSASAVTAIVRIRPGSSNFTGLQTSYFGGNVSTTMRAWDANMNAFAGVLTAANIIGYDASTFSISPSGGSSGTNNLYGIRFPTFQINNTNATWGEAITGLFKGVRRSISSPTITTQATIVLEPPTAATSDQIAFLIRNATSEQAVATTNRIGLDILASNSTAPNVYAIRTGNFVDLSSASAKQTTVLKLHQLATGAVAGAHINFDDKAGDPPSPTAGDLWRNGTALNYRKDGATTVDLTASSSGETIRKNSGANVGTRPRLNLIEGSNVTLTVSDDGVDNEVDITIAAAAGSLTLTEVEKDLGATAQYSGTFDITGLAGLTAAKQVLIVQKAGPYTGKGDRQDEAEMDIVASTGYVVDANTIRAYWTCQPHSGPMVGSVKFGYAVSA